MAAAIFRAQVEAGGEGAQWRIESAGTWGVDGSPASALAQTVMTQRGITLDGHIARTVDQELLRDADVIVVMTRSHRDALVAEFPNVREKLYLISELNGFEYDVADPYGRPRATYEACAETLEQLITRGSARVAQWANASAARLENV